MARYETRIAIAARNGSTYGVAGATINARNVVRNTGEFTMTVLFIDHADVVKRAAAVLVHMYRESVCELRTGLGIHHGVTVANQVPVGVFHEPYDVELGVVGMRDAVRAERVLLVSLLNADTAIYGAEGNAWFRFFHDLGHMLYELDFNAEDENKLHDMLWYRHLTRTQAFAVLSKLEQTLVRVVYAADTFGQTDHFTEHGEFPADQTAFAISYLKERV